MKKIARAALALVAALGLAVPAAAAQYELFGWELNPYAGAAFGRSAITGDCGNGAEDGAAPEQPRFGSPNLTLTVAYEFLRCEGSDTGFKLYGGLRIYEYLALEGGYVSMGSHLLRYKGTETGGEMREGEGDVMVEHDGSWTGSVVGMLPVARFVPRTILPAGEVFALGRVGMHWWSVLAHPPEGGVEYRNPMDDMMNSSGGDGYALRHREDDSGLDLYFGVGGEYLLDNGVGFRLEWERYLFDGDWRKADVDMISLGALYRF